jgi:predicted NAD-dependent protein-ADP-ribosyltransferase YbiA (DUF1768 family)
VPSKGDEQNPPNLPTINTSFDISSKGTDPTFFTKHSPFSNHHPTQFTIDGSDCGSNEQFLFAMKARYCGDDTAELEI